MCKKILIVDDDSNFVHGIMISYLKEGSSFSYADSLQRASDLLLIDNFDLIIANAKIPGGSSLNLKKIISPETEILFISAIEAEYYKLTQSGEKCYKKYELSKSIEALFVNA